ncbi:hypothetical protein ACPCI1_09770 [Streptomyces seoulensis]|uniref:hypothetical protein n=1 Tax=Streptomyces seoulensis TaxID=73044 RepID=UPI003C2C7D08
MAFAASHPPSTARTAHAGKHSPVEAADVPSATLAARLSGKRVEALSERTETSQTWVNPNGSLTTEAAAGPVRFKRAGKWVDVDLNLEAHSDGSVAPAAHPEGLILGGRGGSRPHR